MGESSIMGELICRDNLEVLCDWYSQGKREFIDLIYIDPPFGNNMDKEWGLKWNKVEDYTNWMYPRVYLMKEMLKPTGSFYYHCDPTASHYVKMMLDMIFGIENFRNEIVWCYGKWTNVSKQFQENHDVILFYSKSKDYTFNRLFDEENMRSHHERGYHTNTIHSESGMKSQIIVYDESKVNDALLKKYDNVVYRLEQKAVVLPDWWNISIINSQAKERLGYPTQKPEKLLERIILASSNPKDLVADLYLGGGTTIAVAEKLDRNWIGVDINPRAIEISEQRIKDLI